MYAGRQAGFQFLDPALYVVDDAQRVLAREPGRAREDPGRGMAHLVQEVGLDDEHGADLAGLGARTGLEIGGMLQRMYPGRIRFLDNSKLIGSRRDMEDLQNGVDPRIIHDRDEEELKNFLTRRAKHLLY